MEYGAHYDSLIMGGSMRCSQTRISMDPVSSTTLRPCSKVTPVGDALDGAADFERVSAHVQHRHGCLATELHADPGTDSDVNEGGKTPGSHIGPTAMSVNAWRITSHTLVRCTDGIGQRHINRAYATQQEDRDRIGDPLNRDRLGRFGLD